MKYKLGDKVQVVLPPRELTISSTIRQYHGEIAVITGSHDYSSNGRTYTLGGFVGKNNMPYHFIEEWLRPYVESEDEV